MNKHQIAAKKYLSQAFGLNQRIESKLGQIEELHDLATKATVTYSDMPRNPNKGHSRLEDAVIKIIELENEINKDMVELVELKKDIIRRIKAVESTELQTVLELRYLSYMRWEEIAIELGYGIDNVFRLHRNALDEIKIDRCQANQRSLVLIRAVRTLQMVVTVRSISRRSTVIMRSTAGIKQRRKDTVVHGRGSVTNMLRSIPSVSCVLNVESSCRLKRYIIRSR